MAKTVITIIVVILTMAEEEIDTIKPMDLVRVVALKHQGPEPQPSCTLPS